MELFSSRLPQFYKKSIKERRKTISDKEVLSKESFDILTKPEGLPIDVADRMIENVIGTYQLPLGIAGNFVINGKEVLIPMVVEEPSVVAAASNMARLARRSGGFKTSYTGSIMIAQMHVLGLRDPEKSKAILENEKVRMLEQANTYDQTLHSLGGGAKDLEIRLLNLRNGDPVLAIHLIVDVLDAMGANAVNTMTERLTPEIERLTGGTVLLRILSNLAEYRLAEASVSIPLEHLVTDEFTGEEVARRIELANEIALVDPYRAATHNKGIMNGVDPVVLATGNDWRAIEAGAHAFAAISGEYKALTEWRVEHGKLNGSIRIPMAVGIVGGATKTHPAAKACLELMKVDNSSDLAQIIAAVGLAQNMGAIRALATEGIQKGHMALHARNIAVQAGATGDQIDWLSTQMVESKNVSMDKATALLQHLKEKKKSEGK